MVGLLVAVKPDHAKAGLPEYGSPAMIEGGAVLSRVCVLGQKEL